MVAGKRDPILPLEYRNDAPAASSAVQLDLGAIAALVLRHIRDTKRDAGIIRH